MRIISIEEWEQLGHKGADYRYVATVNIDYRTLAKAFDLPIEQHIDPELGAILECAFETDTGRPYYIQQTLDAKDVTKNYIKIYCQHETANGQPFDNVRIQNDLIEVLHDLNVNRCQLVSVSKRFDVHSIAALLKTDSELARRSALVLTL